MCPRAELVTSRPRSGPGPTCPSRLPLGSKEEETQETEATQGAMRQRPGEPEGAHGAQGLPATWLLGRGPGPVSMSLDTLI